MSNYRITALHSNVIQAAVDRIRQQHGSQPPTVLVHPSQRQQAATMLERLGLSIAIDTSNGGVLVGEAWLEIPEDEPENS